jgi:hypothetical protein
VTCIPFLSRLEGGFRYVGRGLPDNPTTAEIFQERGLSGAPICMLRKRDWLQRVVPNTSLKRQPSMVGSGTESARA